MHSSNVSTHGMAVAPHHLASQSALAILREGGSAIEAMVAAAAAIAVVYPHMNGLGGDGFWLIVPPEGDPIAIDASGAAGSLATLAAYAGQRHIPTGAAGRADRRRHRQRLGRGAADFTGLNRPRAAGGAPAGRCDRLCRRRHSGHRLAGPRHRQQTGRAAPSAGLQRNLAGRGRGPAARQPLPPARPRRYPAHAGQRRSRQFLSRSAG